jgi:hypothetical protein
MLEAKRAAALMAAQPVIETTAVPAAAYLNQFVKGIQPTGSRP